MKEKVIHCQDCYRFFIFTETQQEFYAANGWDDPIRCPKCRAEKRMRRKESDYIAALMENREMRLYSKHGRGYFRKLGRY